MVNRFVCGILCLALILGACAKTKTQAPPQKQVPKDASLAELRSRSTAIFAEKDAPQFSQARESAPALDIRMNKTKVTQLGEAVVVEIDTFLVFNYGVSIQEAESKTRELVRRLALEKAQPEDVFISNMTALMEVERGAHFDESIAMGVFMMSSSAGRFLEEEFLKKEPIFDSKINSLIYRMHYRAKILPQERIYNPSMELKLKLSNSLLKDGETFKLSLSPNMAGYFYFFNFLSDGSVALVAPNLDYLDNYLEAGEKWEQTITAICDTILDYSIETLYFVFSLDPIAGWEDFRSNRNSQDLVFSAGEESFILFQSWLAKSDPQRRTEKMAQLHILR